MDERITVTIQVAASPRPEWFKETDGTVSLQCDPPDPWWRCCRCGLGFKELAVAEAHRRTCESA